MKSNGRGRVLKQRFGKFEAGVVLQSAALHILKSRMNSISKSDLQAYELLMNLHKDLKKK